MSSSRRDLFRITTSAARALTQLLANKTLETIGFIIDYPAKALKAISGSNRLEASRTAM
jgi:hypothetical protein